jgi:acyl-CoA thioesterase FadM
VDHSPASVVLQRRIEWIDTDAAGVFHYTTVFRLAEAAEALLHDRLGIVETTFGATPRVHVDADFRRSLLFNDLVEVELVVDHVGEASCRQRFTIRRGDEVAVEGQVTMAFIDRGTRRAVPWPDEVRERLTDGGPQEPVLLG